MLQGKHILLIISGGIAAYKSLDLIRRLRERGVQVSCILTAGGARFITPLAVSSVSGETTYQDLFSLTDDAGMSHIRLSRDADLIVVAPASADLLARMAQGRADDLAAAVLLAANKDILVAPAMNSHMWQSPATRRNWRLLEAQGVRHVAPGSGDLACGEHGPGRMAEPMTILAAVEDYFSRHRRLAGARALVTAGPTHEPIDPVRYLGNRSSGRQGYALAAALADMGAQTVLVSGPTALDDPPGVEVHRVDTARQMLAACQAALPVDVAVCAAAVADWCMQEVAPGKIKKRGAPPSLRLQENPDIVKELAAKGASRPRLVVGFAAETDDLLRRARAKRRAKGCDWMLANDVSQGVFGAATNRVVVIDDTGEEVWPEMSKTQIGSRLAQRIADCVAQPASSRNRPPVKVNRKKMTKPKTARPRIAGGAG